MSEGLVEFLLARWDEEGRLATPERRPHETHGMDAVGTYRTTCPSCVQMAVGNRLAERIDSWRRTVAEHMPTEDGTQCRTCAHFTYQSAGGWLGEGEGAPWPCLTLRLLALPYASHPAYREEWKP